MVRCVVLKYFYPRPPRGGRPCAGNTGRNLWVFLSTPPARRATQQEQWQLLPHRISIHAPREEGDTNVSRQTTLSAEISIHAPREEGDVRDDGFQIRLGEISIHAPREEGDISIWLLLNSLVYFYPRPPRGGRLPPPDVGVSYWLFLSTPPARRATLRLAFQTQKYFEFLSTPPARRATQKAFFPYVFMQISIHAPREEGDPAKCPPCRCTSQNFYPRPPRGGRPRATYRITMTM